MLKALPARFLASPEPGGWRRRPRRGSLKPVSAALMTNPAYFEVGRFLGGYGFMNITSYSSSQFGEPSNVAGIQDLGLGYSAEEIERLRVQDVGEGEVTIRLYEGRVVQGPWRGTQAVFKERHQKYSLPEKQLLKEQKEIDEFLNVCEVLRNSKQWPYCKMAISKTQGCNHMTCRNCGKSFCYRCNQRVSGYNHFWSGDCELFEHNNQGRRFGLDEVADGDEDLDDDEDPEELEPELRLCPCPHAQS